MKIYKHWTVETYTAPYGHEQVQFICYGGSNSSLEDARAQADKKAERVKLKIAGKHYQVENYEVEIREELLREINPQNIITRNRYGAQILNSENLLILDIDKPKFGGILSLFKKDPRTPKERIFDMISELAETKYSQYTFRLYETYQGARVIVLGEDFTPNSPYTESVMKAFHCDPLYTHLCIKQRCFRARLTPKPARMKLRNFKVPYPRQGDHSEFQSWLAEYESLSRGYSVCKLIKQIGSSSYINNIVRLHDEMTGVGYPQPLA